jgi:hypothetical protein
LGRGQAGHGQPTQSDPADLHPFPTPRIEPLAASDAAGVIRLLVEWVWHEVEFRLWPDQLIRFWITWAW